MELIYSFAVALFLTIALIPLLIRYSAKLSLLDDPSDPRKVHTTAIPRSGGLAIAVGCFLPLVFLLPMGREFQGLLGGAVIIVIFGVLDDRFELNYKWKFLGQILAVLMVMSAGIVMHRVPFMGLDEGPMWITYPLTFFFLLGVTNAVNLTDGLDGLAAGTTLLSLIVVTIFALKADYHVVALFAITVIGGVLGFLRYNTFPARIFMGDTGSQFLGFAAATLALLVTQHEAAAYSPVVPLLIMGLPILDTITVMSIRIREGRSPFSPDKNHLHHQLMRLGFQHYEAVAFIYLVQIALMICAYTLCYENDGALLLLYFGFCLGAWMLLFLGHRSGWQFREISDSENPADRRNNFLRKLDWIYYNSAHVVEWMMAIVLVGSALIVGDVRGDFAITALVVAAALILMWISLGNMPALITRSAGYTASVFAVYLIAQVELQPALENVLNGGLIALAMFLMLAIRMTRREEFRLDTQDLLILLMIVAVPQLPFQTLDQLSVGEVVLRLAVLMYGCEFILAKSRSRFRVFNVGAVSALLILAAQGL